jgi:hypothetical protein
MFVKEVIIMTVEQLIEDLHALENELQKFEKKYNLLSPFFYKLYQTGKLEGEIHFLSDIKLCVYETIDFDNDAIETYSYEVYKSSDKSYWYDSQAHPHDPSLASTHPHHIIYLEVLSIWTWSIVLNAL